MFPEGRVWASLRGLSHLVNRKDEQNQCFGVNCLSLVLFQVCIKPWCHWGLKSGWLSSLNMCLWKPCLSLLHILPDTVGDVLTMKLPNLIYPPTHTQTLYVQGCENSKAVGRLLSSMLMHIVPVSKTFNVIAVYIQVMWFIKASAVYI